MGGGEELELQFTKLGFFLGFAEHAFTPNSLSHSRRQNGSCLNKQEAGAYHDNLLDGIHEKIPSSRLHEYHNESVEQIAHP